MADIWPELPRRASKIEILRRTLDTVSDLADDRIAESERENARLREVEKAAKEHLDEPGFRACGKSDCLEYFGDHPQRWCAACRLCAALEVTDD